MRGIGSMGTRRAIRRRRLLGTALAGSAGAAFLAACGGGSDDEEGGSSGVTEATIAQSTRVAETSQPKLGGTISTRQSANSPLDPHTNTTFTAQTLASYMYSRLLKYKTGIDPTTANNYEIEGDLAETVEMPGDGRVVTFKLRPNAKWQDIAPVSGRVVEAEDVKFSFDRFRTEPRSSNKGVFGTPENPLVESVETPDPRTVVFRLARPYAPFTNLIANSNYLWIMPKEIGAGTVDPSKQMIGSGPFILESVQPDIAYKVRKNPNWYGAPMPYIDGINLTIITEETQEVAQYQAQRLDIAAIPPARVEEIKRAIPKGLMVEYIPSTYGFLSMQQRGNSPFKDERIRRAAAMSIDRDGILTLAYESKGSWLSAIPGSFGNWRVDPKSADMGAGGQYFKYNPAESKKLLAAAGYANGMPLRYIFTNNIYGERFNQVAEAVAGMLKEGGFQPQVVTADYLREYIPNPSGIYYGNYEGAFYGLQTDFGDPHDYLHNMNHSKSLRNHAGISDPMLDAMIDKEALTLDTPERIKAVKEIQRYLGDKQYYQPGAIGPAYIGVQEWIKNYQRNNAYSTGTESRTKLWIDRG
jgi:peptide/nickel transport system substrate-binding protein